MFETEEKVTGVAVAIVRDRKSGKFVWVKNVAHPKPKLKNSGGTIESKESMGEAVLREVRQETGLMVKEEDLLYLFEYPNQKRGHSFYVYFAEVDGLGRLSREPVQDGEELIAAVALSLDEIRASKDILFIHKEMFLQGMKMMNEA